MKNLTTLSILFLVFLLGPHYLFGQMDEQSAKLMSELKAHNQKDAMILVNNKINANYADKENVSLLMIAALNGFTDVCKILIEKKAKLDLKAPNGESALNMAVREGHSEVVRLLLNNEATSYLLKDGNTNLHIAAKNGHTEMLKVLLEKYSPSLNDFDETPLMIGALYGHSEVVELFIANGANINQRNNFGETALMMASHEGHKDVVKVLLEKGGKVNLRTNSGETAFSLASQKGHIEVMDLLKDYGADVNFQNSFGEPVLTDIDGNTYKTVQIGTQIWMAENLRTTKFNDGTSIPSVVNNGEWNRLSTPGFSWYFDIYCDKIIKFSSDSMILPQEYFTFNLYENIRKNYKLVSHDDFVKIGEAIMNVYGALYNWYTVNTGKLCPAGWHVPTAAEWDTLMAFAGSEPGGKLKESGNLFWGKSVLFPSTLSSTTNEYGFSALPGGYRWYYGPFSEMGGLPESSISGDEIIGDIRLRAHEPLFDYRVELNKHENQRTLREYLSDYGINLPPISPVVDETLQYRVCKGHWWTSSGAGRKYAWNRNMSYVHNGYASERFHKRCGLSVRCVKD